MEEPVTHCALLDSPQFPLPRQPQAIVEEAAYLAQRFTIWVVLCVMG